MAFPKHMLPFLFVMLMAIGDVQPIGIESTTMEISTAVTMEEATEEEATNAATELVTTDMTTTDLVTVYTSPVTVVASMTLDETYTSDLEDPTSTEYIALEEEFLVEMDAIMDAEFGSTYNSTEVLGFSPGSIVVDFKTIFNEAPVASNDYLKDTTTEFEAAINAAITGGTLGGSALIVTAFRVSVDNEVYSFGFVDAAEDLSFDVNVDNIYGMTITLRNVGGVSLDSILNDGDSSNNDADNFAIYFVVSDTDDLDDSSAMTIWSVADTSEATNMQAGISSGSSLVLADVFAMVNIPKADCGLYTHLCVFVNGTSEAVWSDSDSSNDYSCIDSFGYEDTEYLPCSGCITRASLLVVFVSMVTRLL